MTTLAPNCVQFPEPIMCSSNQVLVNYVWLGGQFGLSHTCKTRDRAMAEALFGFSPIYTPATNSCTPTSVNSTQPCDPGYVGNKIITTSTSCPGNVVTTTTNTSGCSLACVPQAAQTQFVPCGGNLSGTKMQTNTFSCPSGTWSGWVDTDTSMCVANNSLAQQQCQTKGGSWNTSTQHCDCNTRFEITGSTGVPLSSQSCDASYLGTVPHGGYKTVIQGKIDATMCFAVPFGPACYGTNQYAYQEILYSCNEGVLSPDHTFQNFFGSFPCPIRVGNESAYGYPSSNCGSYTQVISPQTTVDNLTVNLFATVRMIPGCGANQNVTSSDPNCNIAGYCYIGPGVFPFNYDCTHNTCTSGPLAGWQDPNASLSSAVYSH